MNLSSTGLVEILKSACRIKARFLRAIEEQTQTGIFEILQLDNFDSFRFEVGIFVHLTKHRRGKFG